MTGLLGRTRRQRVIRAAEFATSLGVVGMIVLWTIRGASPVEGGPKPFMTIYYWPTCFALVLLWTLLALMDLKEGLRAIADRKE